MDLGSLLRTELAGCVAALDENDRDVVGERSPDQVHDARVALRRIRSQLRTFTTLVDPVWAREIRTEIAWYEDLLGRVRDCDVLAARLLDRTGSRREPATAAAITARLAAERASQLRLLADGRTSRRYLALRSSLDELASRPPLRSRASLDASTSLLPRLATPWRDLRASARRAARNPDAEALHTLRIRAKQLRYGAEMSEAVLGDDARTLAGACAGLQGHLGRYRDAGAAAAWLRLAFGADDLGAPMSALASRQDEIASTLGTTWRPLYKAVRHAWLNLERDAPR